MTEVEFHTQVADPLDFACRLLRKASRQGVRVQVTAPARTLATLDRALWTFEERDFVPHVRMPGAPSTMAKRSPIWLAAQAQVGEAPRVLLNLGADQPDDPSVVDRLIEIVSTEPEAAEQARLRWRAYKALGLPIKHHGAG